MAMMPVFSGCVKLPSAGFGGRFKSAAARCEWFGGKLSLGGHKISVRRAGALAADAHSCRRGQLPRSVCGGGVSGGLGRLWVRSAGFALAFVVFASALLLFDSVRAQSGLRLSFSASGSILFEGRYINVIELRIGLPNQHVGRRVVLEIAAEGTAVMGRDYFIVAPDSAPGIELRNGESSIEVEVPTAPPEILQLRLISREEDSYFQPTRIITLEVIRYEVEPESNQEVALPRALSMEVRDNDKAVVERLLDINDVGACVVLEGGSVHCWSHSPSRVLAFSSDDIEDNPQQLKLDGDDACWIRADYQIRCSSSNPFPFSTADQIDISGGFGCALRDGTVRCYGSSRYGRPSFGSRITQFAVGAGSSPRVCAVTNTDQLLCRQLDSGSVAPPPENLGSVTQVALADDFSCALTIANQVRCWGSGRNWNLDHLAPAVQIAALEHSICALREDGTVRCFSSSRERSDFSSFEDGEVTAIVSGVGGLCLLYAEGDLDCRGRVGSDDLDTPLELRRSEVTMSVSPQRLKSGQRATIRFTRKNGDGLSFAARFLLLGTAPDHQKFKLVAAEGSDVFRNDEDGLLYAIGNPPTIFLMPINRSGRLYVQLVPLDGGGAWVPPAEPPRFRQPERLLSQSQEMYLVEAIALSRLDVSVATGFRQAVAPRGEHVVEFNILVLALDGGGQPIDAAGLSFFAERVSGSAVTWSPTSEEPQELVDNLGVGSYIGRLMVTLGEDDAGLRLRIQIRGFDPESGVVAETVEVAVVRELRFGSSVSYLSEGGSDEELLIDLPIAPVDGQVELSLVASGEAQLGSDYTLIAANSASGIVLATDEEAGTVTLRLDSVPEESIRLLLRPRRDDDIAQGSRNAELRVSHYRVGGNEQSLVALPPAHRITIYEDDLFVAEHLLDVGDGAACALSNLGSVYCWSGSDASNDLSQVIDSISIDSARQLGIGYDFICWLRKDDTLRCKGANDYGQLDIPPDLSTLTALAVGGRHVCVLQSDDRVRCWGRNEYDQALPPEDLDPVTQLVSKYDHSCALQTYGWVSCWGDRSLGQSSPPGGLGRVAQVAVGWLHSCALRTDGRVRCWGHNFDGQSSPPTDLGPVAQLALGDEHSCALQTDGRVRCWGDNRRGQSTVPQFPESPVTAIAAGGDNSCALLAEGSIICWGSSGLGTPDELAPADLAMSVLPRLLDQPGQRAVIRFADFRDNPKGFDVRIELFGSGLERDVHYRLLDAAGDVLTAGGDGNYLLAGNPLPLAYIERLGGVVESPLRLHVRSVSVLPVTGSTPSIRAVARPVDWMKSTSALSVLRVSAPSGAVEGVALNGEVVGEISIQVEGIGPEGQQTGVVGLMFFAELIRGSAASWSPTQNLPQPLSGTTEAGVFTGLLRVSLGEDDIFAVLRIGVSGFNEAAGIVVATTEVRVARLLSFTAAASTTTERAAGIALRIGLPLAHRGRQVVMTVSVGGTAELGLDYTLVATDSAQGVILSFDAVAKMVTMSLDSVPDGQLKLLLQPRDNFTVEEDRSVKLRISSYRVDLGENEQSVALPEELSFAIVDDDLLPVPVVERFLAVDYGVACAALSGGSIRCWHGSIFSDRLESALRFTDFGAVRQLDIGDNFICWWRMDRTVRCEGDNYQGQLNIPSDLSAVTALAVGEDHTCALQTDGRVLCWGYNGWPDNPDGRVTPPEDLGQVVLLVSGDNRSCALQTDGRVRCWGRDLRSWSSPPGDLGPVAQLALGDSHGCALQTDGRVRCWGSNSDGRSSPPEDLGPVAQLALGDDHSCALQTDGRVRCWGDNSDGRSSPPRDLGPVAQLALGDDHSCALQTDGRVRCWGRNRYGQSSPPHFPPGSVTEIAAGEDDTCALLGDGSVRCWGRQLQQAVPADLRSGDVVMTILHRRLEPGQRTAIRFSDLRDTTAAFTARIELFSPEAELGLHYQLLDLAGEALIAGPDGSYLLAGDPFPVAYIEALDGRGEPPLRLQIRPVVPLPVTGSPPSIRAATRYVDLVKSTSTLSVLRVSVPSGAVEGVALNGEVVGEVSIQVEGIGPEGQRVGAAGLMFFAELISGSAASWSPTQNLPQPLSGTTEAGVFTGQLRVSLGEDDSFAVLRIGASGFDEAAGIVVVTTEVRVARLLRLTAAASTTTEKAAGIALRIGLPLAHRGRQVELVLSVGGTAELGLDYTLVATDPAQGVILSFDAVAKMVTMSLDSVPEGQLKLLLKPRDNLTAEEDRSVKLRISSYRVGLETDEQSVVLPEELSITIANDDLPVPVGERFLAVGSGVACVALSGGSVSCWHESISNYGLRAALESTGIRTARQLGIGYDFICWLRMDRTVRCEGANSIGQATPPDDLGPVAQLMLGNNHSCALQTDGRVRCWGSNSRDQLSPPNDLGPVAQLAVGDNHSCALQTDGRVRCWGSNSSNRSSPLSDLGPVAQLALGSAHSCALQTDGRVRCWGSNSDGRSLPPRDLGPVAQLAVGDEHSCALQTDGRVRCWGRNRYGQSSPPHFPPGSVTEIAAGENDTCALLADGSVRCWGEELEQAVPAELRPADVVMRISHRRLEPGQRTAIRFSDLRDMTAAFTARIELFSPEAELGLHYQLLNSAGEALTAGPDGSYLLAGDPFPVAYIEALDGRGEPPLRLQIRPVVLLPVTGSPPSIRAATRYVDLAKSPLSVLRVSVPSGTVEGVALNGEVASEISIQVEGIGPEGQRAGVAGLMFSAALVSGSAASWSPTQNLPQPLLGTMEAGVFTGQLRVGLGESDASVALRIGVSGFDGAAGAAVETTTVYMVRLLSFTAAASEVIEGSAGVELRIDLPLGHRGRQVEISLAETGTARLGLDYTLSAAEPAQGIVIYVDEGMGTAILSLDAVPAEPLRLLLWPRAADDVISQGDRRAELRISRYQVGADNGPTAAFPEALSFHIADDDLPAAERFLAVGSGVACVALSGGSVSCWHGPGIHTGVDAALDSPDIRSARQLGIGNDFICWLRMDRTVRCGGDNPHGQLNIPSGLSGVTALAVGDNHVCALPMDGRVRCWGGDSYGESSPPGDLGPVAQLALDSAQSCALQTDGGVRCWGSNSRGKSSPPMDLGPVAQLALGGAHSCALQTDGRVRCWGRDFSGESSPPGNLDPVVQLVLGYEHSCALTIGGEVRCWGYDGGGRSSPPGDLGPVAQLVSGYFHSCALQTDGQVRCWGSTSPPNLPPGSGVTEIAAGANGTCALLADGSVRCWGDGLESGVAADLQSSDVVMSVLPQRLQPGQRAAIRFADLRNTPTAFGARIEVFGDDLEVGIHYRLLNLAEQPLAADSNGSYLLTGEPLPGAYIEALLGGFGRPLRLYVRPLEALPVAGPTPSLRSVAQLVELQRAETLGRVTLRLFGGARQLRTGGVTPVRVPLELSLLGGDGPLSAFARLSVRLKGVATGDGVLVPSGPFELAASGTVAGTTAVQVILGVSGETVVSFSVLGLPSGTTVELLPKALRVIRLAELPVLDIDEDERVGTEDIILIMKFMTGGRDKPSLRGTAMQARLESLVPADVVDLRMDLDGNGRMETTDLRIILRHLAGLRGSALGEGVSEKQVEAMFGANR